MLSGKFLFLKLFKAPLCLHYYKMLELTQRNNIKVARNCVISPTTVNSVVFVHQGYNYLPIKITKFHVGYKYGMFTATRKPFVYKSKKKKGR